MVGVGRQVEGNVQGLGRQGGLVVTPRLVLQTCQARKAAQRLKATRLLASCKTTRARKTLRYGLVRCFDDMFQLLSLSFGNHDGSRSTHGPTLTPRFTYSQAFQWDIALVDTGMALLCYLV